MFHSLYNTALRTLNLVHAWLPDETQLLGALREITFSMEPLTALVDPGAPELIPMAEDCRNILETAASYIRAMHDILPSSVPPADVLSISTLIHQDLERLDGLQEAGVIRPHAA